LTITVAPRPIQDKPTIATIKAMDGPDGVKTSYLLAIQPPGGATSYMVAGLDPPFEESMKALRWLGRELVARYPGNRRLYVSRRSGVSFNRVQECLKDLDIEVRRGWPRTVQANTLHLRNVLSRQDTTVLLPPHPITVATDGTLNPATGVAAAGFVTETGVNCAHECRCDPDKIVEAEVTAICMTLEAFPAHDLLVLADSKVALRIVWQAMDNQDVPSSRLQQILYPTPGWLFVQLRYALDRYGGHAKFRWVQGHAGHPLNEAADRLVRAVRRQAEGTAPRGSAQLVKDNIRDELCPA
jgi:ribonuclease H